MSKIVTFGQMGTHWYGSVLHMGNVSLGMDSRANKARIIENLKGGTPVEGVPKQLAQKTFPDYSDEKIRDLVENSIWEFVRQNANLNAPEKMARLIDLHKYLEVDLIDDCSTYVKSEIQLEMMQWAYHVCVERLGFAEQFFLDREIYVRINFPFEIANKGKLSRETHPNHRLTAYNIGRPKATWSHGPHKDSWYGHSHTAINFWFSICGTNFESTMNLFPNEAYKATAYNEKTMYASYDHKLTEEVGLELAPGENLIFDPELLHSTRINTSTETRVVLTIRVSDDEPIFSDSIKHDVYDLWVSSDSVSRGDLVSFKVGKRIPISDYPKNNLKLDAHTFDTEKSLSDDTEQFERSEFNVEDDVIFELIFEDGSCLGVWHDGSLFKFGKFCPHIGAPLIGGTFDPNKLVVKCPAHGAEFCIKSGRSRCSALRLRVL